MTNIRTITRLILIVPSTFCILLYTWFHTGAVLQSYIDVWPVGYIAAIGIELSIVGMSLEIGWLRHQKKNASTQIAILVAVLAVSALANIYEGYKVSTDNQLEVVLMDYNLVLPIVLIVSTGLLSIIAFALSEMVSSTVEDTVKLFGTKHQTKEDKPTKEDRHKLIPELKGASAEQLADRFRVSQATIYNDLKELGISLNGN